MPREIIRDRFSPEGAESAASLESKLNRMFAEIYAANPSLTKRETLLLSAASATGQIDTPRETARKLNAMIEEISVAAGLPRPQPIVFDLDDAYGLLESSTVKLINDLTYVAYGGQIADKLATMYLKNSTPTLYAGVAQFTTIARIHGVPDGSFATVVSPVDGRLMAVRDLVGNWWLVAGPTKSVATSGTVSVTIRAQGANDLTLTVTFAPQAGQPPAGFAFVTTNGGADYVTTNNGADRVLVRV